MRHVSRLNKTKQKFQFTITVDTLDLQTKISPTLGIQWTRGGRTAVSSFKTGQNGIVNWNNEKLTLVSSMFKNTATNKYEKKRSKLTIKQKIPGQKTGREKRVGVIELDLAEYCAMDNTFELNLPLKKCHSIKNASLTFKLHSLWIKAMDNEDDAASVSQLSMISTGTNGVYHAIAEPKEDEDYGYNPDIANLSELDAFDDQLENDYNNASNNNQQTVQGEVYEVRMGSLEDEIRTLRGQNEDLTRKVAINGESGFSEEWKNLHQELKLAQTDLDVARNKTEAEKKRYEEEIRRLKEEIRTHIANTSDQTLGLKKILEEKEEQCKKYLEQRKKLDEEIVTEKANGAELQIELSSLRQKHRESSKSLVKVREEVAKLTKKNQQQRLKYNDLMKTLHMNPNELMRQVGFFRTQADDLEGTLMMVRKSWKDTSHIMETQINAMNSELLSTKMKNKTLKEKLSNSKKKVESLQSEIDQLNEYKLKMSQVLTKHEVSMAQKMVELVNSNNQLQAAKEQVLQLQHENENIRNSKITTSDMHSLKNEVESSIFDSDSLLHHDDDSHSQDEPITIIRQQTGRKKSIDHDEADFVTPHDEVDVNYI